jgi:hypothetical protein
MNFKNSMMEWIADNYIGLSYPTGYEDCIIGVLHRPGGKPVCVMNMDQMIVKLVTQDGMSLEDAMEYFEYNILGAYVGDQTPIYVQLPDFSEED